MTRSKSKIQNPQFSLLRYDPFTVNPDRVEHAQKSASETTFRSPTSKIPDLLDMSGHFSRMTAFPMIVDSHNKHRFREDIPSARSGESAHEAFQAKLGKSVGSGERLLVFHFNEFCIELLQLHRA